MAVFTRVNGDAAGVVNVDAGRSLANAVIINTGIAAPLTAYKVTFGNGNIGGSELVTGGAVETALRAISGNATVLAYQADTGSQLSVLVERSGWVSDAVLQQNLINLGNIGVASAAWVTTVTSTGGIKLA
jgi:hypothetical protein